MEEEITRTARVLVRRYEWRLVTVARLEARVARRLQSTGAQPTLSLDLVCEQEAGAELFAACERGRLRTASPTEQQQMEWAFHDLSNYLTALTPRLLPPAPSVGWEDLVQETLIEVHQKLANCEQPAAFLGWAVTILKRKGAATWRIIRREDPLPADEVAEAALLPRMVEARNRHVDPEGDQDVLRMLHECLDTDEERLRALWDFQGWKRREWAMVFDTPLGRFDRLGVVIKRKLQQCSLFQMLVGYPASAA
jgi:DNA-directed RNA polymerase specialized sigma24 family protein